MTGSHTNDARKPVFTINNMYPEAHASLAMFAQNKGDIPVKLGDVKVTLSADDARIWDYVKAKVNARYLKKGETWDDLIGSKEGYLYYLSDLVKEAVGSQVIYPGDQIRLGREATEDDPDPIGSITIWLDKDTPNDLQDKSFGFDVEMIWEQWNAQ